MILASQQWPTERISKVQALARTTVMRVDTHISRGVSVMREHRVCVAVQGCSGHCQYKADRVVRVPQGSMFVLLTPALTGFGWVGGQDQPPHPVAAEIQQLA